MGAGSPSSERITHCPTGQWYTDPMAESPLIDVVGSSASPSGDSAIPTIPLFNSDELDRNSEKWDGSKHTASRAKTKTGVWRRKRVAKSETEKGRDTHLGKGKYAKIGVAAANATFTLGVMTFGQEWQPRIVKLDDEHTIDEYTDVSVAYADFFAAKNIDDFPPGIALALALAFYALPRFAKPETQTKMSKMKNWVGKKLKWKRKNADTAGTHTDTGDNGLRKVDASASNVGPSAESKA